MAKKPISGTFELTSNCNFNCKMCYVHSCKNRSSDASPEDWIKAVDEAADAGLMYALITGGEPLTYRYFEDVYSAVYKKGVISVLNTNGYLLDRGFIDFLSKMPPSRINITLYGTDNSVYRDLCGVGDGFTQVDRNIKKLQEKGFNVSLNMTFVKSNIHQMNDMVAYAVENKLPLRPTTYVFPSSQNETEERLDAVCAAKAAVDIYRLLHTEDELKKYARETAFKLASAKKIKPFDANRGTTCRAGKSSYWIHSDGRLGFCGMVYSGNELNVFKDGFSAAWKQAVADASETENYASCEKCDYRFICKRCYAMLKSENVKEEELCNAYTCSYYKAYTNELMKIHLE